MNNPAPGWYPDPYNPAAQRWWDGQQWAPPSAPPAPAATPAPGMQPAAVGRTTAPKKSIWKNKWLWIVIGAVVLLGIIINLVNPTPKVAVPDVAGMTAIEAIETIESAGFRAQLKNEADDRTVSNGADFDAVGTDPTAGSEAPEGDRITIIVTEATGRLEAEAAERERIAAEEEAQKQAEREAAKAESEARIAERAAAPLDVVDAQAFCTLYSERQFTYGGKLHTVLGRLAEEQTETGWYMKFEATINNAFGAEQKANVECHMSGTNGAPVMDDWLAY